MKGSKYPNLGVQEDDSDNEEYINRTYPPHVAGAQGQPGPTPPQHGTHQRPTLGQYEAGTWQTPMAPAPLQPSYFQPPVQTAPQQPQTPRQPAQPSQALGSRGTGSGPRPPRTRAAVPPSDPHPRVPRHHLFPQVEEQIGEGVNSGRNWFVLQDGNQEPVLRAPLLIVRCKRDPIHQQNGSLYPAEDAIIPAGTSLTQVCRLYPRHVWGEMLRVFISERWDARRIWELLPHNARNNAINRPWNYIQAAMGREIDIMTQEETGVRRVPPKKKTQTPSADEGAKRLQEELDQVDDDSLAHESIASDENHPANDPYNLQGVDWSNPEELTIPMLIEATRHYRELGLNAERSRLHHTFGGTRERDVERVWRRRHNAWAQTVVDEFERSFGEPIGSREPIEMLRRGFLRTYPRMTGETLGAYGDRANWTAWSHYAGVVQGLLDDAEADYARLIQTETEADAAMVADGDLGVVEEEDVMDDE